MSKLDNVVTKYNYFVFENNVKIGTKFWEQLNQEYYLDHMGRLTYILDSDISVFYSHSLTDRYIPRAVLVDLYSFIFVSLFVSYVGSLVLLIPSVPVKLENSSIPTISFTGPMVLEVTGPRVTTLKAPRSSTK